MSSSRVVIAWIVLSGLASAAALVGYTALQQDLRIAANHPQVEMARAAAARLSAGASPKSLVAADPIDIGSSSDTYLIVVDSNGNVLASSATLGGATVIPPPGVFDFVRGHGEDVLSWQPAAGVRSAIVVDSFRGGYVVAGRSLVWTEDAEGTLAVWALVAWAAALVVVGVVVFAGARLLGRAPRQR